MKQLGMMYVCHTDVNNLSRTLGFRVNHLNRTHCSVSLGVKYRWLSLKNRCSDLDGPENVSDYNLKHIIYFLLFIFKIISHKFDRFPIDTFMNIYCDLPGVISLFQNIMLFLILNN